MLGMDIEPPDSVVPAGRIDDLRYRMIMALNGADLGDPICEQAACICAEIAEQYCAEVHAAPRTPIDSARTL